MLSNTFQLLLYLSSPRKSASNRCIHQTNGHSWIHSNRVNSNIAHIHGYKITSSLQNLHIFRRNWSRHKNGVAVKFIPLFYLNVHYWSTALQILSLLFSNAKQILHNNNKFEKYIGGWNIWWNYVSKNENTEFPFTMHPFAE